jgi:hypothetical protein
MAFDAAGELSVMRAAKKNLAIADFKPLCVLMLDQAPPKVSRRSPESDHNPTRASAAMFRPLGWPTGGDDGLTIINRHVARSGHVTR